MVGTGCGGRHRLRRRRGRPLIVFLGVPPTSLAPEFNRNHAFFQPPGPDAMIELEHVGKIFPGQAAPPRSVISALRSPRVRSQCLRRLPSGCGKSTTLRMINRLIEPTLREDHRGSRSPGEIFPSRRAHELRLLHRLRDSSKGSGCSRTARSGATSRPFPRAPRLATKARTNARVEGLMGPRFGPRARARGALPRPSCPVGSNNASASPRLALAGRSAGAS